MTTWHSGQPPSVGWYEASAILSRDTWRWWNGTHWSQWCSPNFSEKAADFWAKRKETECAVTEIFWTTYWPEGARVPDARDLKGLK
jgi:hypothetical protein